MRRRWKIRSNKCWRLKRATSDSYNDLLITVGPNLRRFVHLVYQGAGSLVYQCVGMRRLALGHEKIYKINKLVLLVWDFAAWFIIICNNYYKAGNR